MRQKEVLAYTAGVVDSDGCITFYRRRRKSGDGYFYTIRVEVGNTNEWIVHWLRMQFGGSIARRKPRSEREKPLFRWYMVSRKAAEFIKLIEPYLQIKKPQAMIALEFQRHKRLGGAYKPIDEIQVLEEAEHVAMQKINRERGRGPLSKEG